MGRTWILQANPKLYDVEAALQAKPVIYWRIPQYPDEVKAGDRALMWRAGKQAGFVGWGVFLTDPKQYDLSRDNDPYWKTTSVKPQQGDYYAPLHVWHGRDVPKPEVAAAVPAHRIVTAPMGTVFPLAGDDLAVLQPLLTAHGYELNRISDDGFEPLPVLSQVEPEPKSGPVPVVAAKITPALFLLSSTPERPTEITIEGDSLRLLLVEREALKTLDETWDAGGVYLLIGKPSSEGATHSVYVGKASGLRSRIKTGHTLKEWTRCIVIQRAGLQPFNASDISWLERRLIDVLLEAPQVDLINKAPPPPELVPDYKAEILERTVVAALGVLGVLGAYVA